MRPFVHEPMNTVSMPIWRIGVPGVRPMYSIAPSAALRCVSSAMSVGSGTLPEMPIPWPGLVPHVTKGSSSSASRWTTVSNSASSSLARVRQ